MHYEIYIYIFLIVYRPEYRLAECQKTHIDVAGVNDGQQWKSQNTITEGDYVLS